MNAPVLVRSSLRTWDLTLLLIFGIGVLLCGAVVASFGPWPLAAILAVGGIACISAAALSRRRRVRLRRWVQDTGTGLVITDPSGKRAVDDNHVLSMALNTTRNFSNGVFKSLTRRFDIWLVSDEGPPEQVAMANTINTGQSDPLASLIARLGDRLFAQAKADIAAGQSVLGEYWGLEGKTLTVRRKREALSCPVEEVVAVDTVDGQVCLWRHGQDMPFAKLPANSANAYLLVRVLGEQLANRPSASTAPAEGQLGRIIFERKPSRFALWVLIGLVVICLLVGLGFSLTPKRDGSSGWIAFGCFVATSLLILGALHCRKAVFRCHEFGVYKSGLTGSRTLRYADLEALTYSATRHYHNGVYTGTIFNLDFEPIPEHKSQRIRYNVTLRNSDQELENLRDQVSRMIAARMAHALAANQPVSWTRKLRFVPDGLEYTPTSVFSRSVAAVVPYRDMRTFNVDQGTFSVWVWNQKKPMIKEETSRRNFFPGFYLFTSIVQGAQKAE
jgi:hypothetical protein